MAIGPGCTARASARTFLFAVLLSAGSGAGAAADPLLDLTEMSLDALLNIEVTSVSRRAEPLTEAAAAVFVLTGEEIRRSGVLTIAEALRMVPGLYVARSDAMGYDISSRGMGSDKLEVRLDGRSVYSPFTSRVFWDSLDTFVGDIDRIEVIRGPGAALWGANAVNGVINIITKSSADTHGLQLHAVAGTEEKALAAARTGFGLAGAGDGRIYAQARDRDASVAPDGSSGHDNGSLAQAGFRADLLGGRHERNRLRISGDYFHSAQHTSDGLGGFVPLETSGANLVTRFEHAFGENSEISVQAYYDHSRRLQQATYAETRDTLDFDAQHLLRIGAANEVIYGLGYRNTGDRFGPPPEFILITDPQSRANQTWNAFAQDQVSFGGGRGTLTVGSRFEHNDITGFEAEPNLRGGWKLADGLFTWASVARAVRMPNRLDTSVALYCTEEIPDYCDAGETLRIGNPRLRSETVMAYEWGLRYWRGSVFSADLALFYNDYRRLLSQELDASLDALYQNKLRANSTGGELSVRWQPRDDLDLNAFVSYLGVDAKFAEGGTDEYGRDTLETLAPRRQAGLRAGWQFAPSWFAGGFARHVGAQPGYVPSYTELDLRLAWRVHRSLEIALVGENLLHDRHFENVGLIDLSGAAATREIQRAGRLELTWNWK
jgi:iron complex outermembrane recepter protein